jgi:hypothetical protein
MVCLTRARIVNCMYTQIFFWGNTFKKREISSVRNISYYQLEPKIWAPARTQRFYFFLCYVTVPLNITHQMQGIFYYGQTKLEQTAWSLISVTRLCPRVYITLHYAPLYQLAWCRTINLFLATVCVNTLTRNSLLTHILILSDTQFS